MEAVVRSRSLVASLAIHGAAVLGLAYVVPKPFETPPEGPELFEIEVVEPVRQVSPPKETLAAPTRTVAAPAAARPRPAGPAGAGTPAPHDPLGDLQLTSERDERGRGGNDGNNRGAGPGSGDGFGGTGVGLGPWSLGGGDLHALVPPAPPSLARGPRPKHDYSNWAFRAGKSYHGAKVVVDLTIDPRGTVANVQLVSGVIPMIDDHAIATARGFEFDPALNDRGDPITSVHRWEFILRDDSSGFGSRW